MGTKILRWILIKDETRKVRMKFHFVGMKGSKTGLLTVERYLLGWGEKLVSYGRKGKVTFGMKGWKLEFIRDGTEKKMTNFQIAGMKGKNSRM